MTKYAAQQLLSSIANVRHHKYMTHEEGRLFASESRPSKGREKLLSHISLPFADPEERVSLLFSTRSSLLISRACFREFTVTLTVTFKASQFHSRVIRIHAALTLTLTLLIDLSTGFTCV